MYCVLLHAWGSVSSDSMTSNLWFRWWCWLAQWEHALPHSPCSVDTLVCHQHTAEPQHQLSPQLRVGYYKELRGAIRPVYDPSGVNFSCHVLLVFCGYINLRNINNATGTVASVRYCNCICLHAIMRWRPWQSAFQLDRMMQDWYTLAAMWEVSRMRWLA